MGLSREESLKMGKEGCRKEGHSERAMGQDLKERPLCQSVNPTARSTFQLGVSPRVGGIMRGHWRGGCYL